MQKIDKISDGITKDILNFLYEDELMNVLTIHYFENQIENLGELYLSYENSKIDALLHTKDDGNSHFTTYYAPSNKSLDKVAQLLGTLKHKDLLLAGNDLEIQYIMDSLDRKSDLYLNTYYKHSSEKNITDNNDPRVELRKANMEDFEIAKKYLISFFEAESEEAKEKIAGKVNLNKIRILELDKTPIGLGSFFGYSENFIDISTVFIDKNYRGKGYGKVLMTLMIEEAKSIGKEAILQASLVNEAANNTYNSVGFGKVCGYAFQFVNEKT